MTPQQIEQYLQSQGTSSEEWKPDFLGTPETSPEEWKPDFLGTPETSPEGWKPDFLGTPETSPEGWKPDFLGTPETSSEEWKPDFHLGAPETKQLPEKKVLLTKLDEALVQTFPKLEPREIDAIRAQLLEYIARGIEQGYDVAIVRREGDTLDLRVLRILVEDIAE